MHKQKETGTIISIWPAKFSGLKGEYKDMITMKSMKKAFGVALFALAIAIVPSTATFAQANTDVTQQINAGTLSSAILDAGRVTVPSPSFAMTATNFSFACQTVTGTLGSASQRLYLINPSATSAAVNLTLAGTGTWTNGGNTYAYNDGAGSGCTNGQLTVNANAGTLTADCVSSGCTGASVTKGSSTAMTGATPVTLLSAPINTPVYRGYLTGVSLSQAIPAEKAAGTYTLQMTITATAI